MIGHLSGGWDLFLLFSIHGSCGEKVSFK
uniref:Uncharacterized protein n=1 Tax=Anguilla anguilla TaxID=7936 RepID=A0A0E9SIB7_ANGAN